MTMGSDPTMTYQPIRASRCPRYSGLNRERNQVDPIRQMSWRKKIRTASSVPIWITAVNAAPGSPHPNSSGKIRRWALLEIGQELGEPLDQPEDDGLEEVEHRHSVGRPAGAVRGGRLIPASRDRAPWRGG